MKFLVSVYLLWLEFVWPINISFNWMCDEIITHNKRPKKEYSNRKQLDSLPSQISSHQYSIVLHVLKCRLLTSTPLYYSQMSTHQYSIVLVKCAWITQVLTLTVEYMVIIFFSVHYFLLQLYIMRRERLNKRGSCAYIWPPHCVFVLLDLIFLRLRH